MATIKYVDVKELTFIQHFAAAPMEKKEALSTDSISTKVSDKRIYLIFKYISMKATNFQAVALSMILLSLIVGLQELRFHFRLPGPKLKIKLDIDRGRRLGLE